MAPTSLSSSVKHGTDAATAVARRYDFARYNLKRAVCGMIVAAMCVNSAVGAAASVGIWSRFEREIENTRQYEDPYRDVTLKTTWERPDGTKVDFEGFYDGETVWKIRFMPDQVGRWTYSASFSDGTHGANGAFECVNSNIPGMISKDRGNPIWFGFKGGRHALIRSFHVGDRFFAENWPQAKRRAFLDWAQQQGYNMLSVASHYLNRDAKGRGRGWKTPDLWPLNAAEYRRMEAIIDDLAGRRMMIYPFAGFFGQSSDFPTRPAEQELYVRYTLARIGPYWNLLFNVAGPEPAIKAKEFQNAMSSEHVHRLGRMIKRRDPFGHLLSIHNPSGDDPYRDADWLSYGTLQGWKDANWKSINRDLLKNHHPAKPLYAQEVFWPGNKYHKVTDKTEIRKKAFVMLLSAAAINYADMNGNSSSGFSGSMDLAEKVQYRHDIMKAIWDFFEKIPYYAMSPAQEIVDRGFCLAEPGRQYLVYLPNGGEVSIDVEGGSYDVLWINAQDTPDSRPGDTTSDGKNLTAPGDGDDWLAYLKVRPR